ncbi:MAG TPA: hypothetical protein VF981_02640 [Gemmatimonadaceae bacterium]
MKSYHVQCSQVDSPTTHIVRNVEARTIVDAISLVLQDCYREKTTEWECTRAELILRVPASAAEDVEGVAV